jgi:hypothetical protein
MRNKLAQIQLFGLNWRSFVALISKLYAMLKKTT